MKAHRVEMTLQRDGTITLDHIPFRAGEPVEVIILSRKPVGAPAEPRYPLSGTNLRLDSPFEPVAEGVRETDR